MIYWIKKIYEAISGKEPVQKKTYVLNMPQGTSYNFYNIESISAIAKEESGSFSFSTSATTEFPIVVSQVFHGSYTLPININMGNGSIDFSNIQNTGTGEVLVLVIGKSNALSEEA